jgi:hypothetical protein
MATRIMARRNVDAPVWPRDAPPAPLQAGLLRDPMGFAKRACNRRQLRLALKWRACWRRCYFAAGAQIVASTRAAISAPCWPARATMFWNASDMAVSSMILPIASMESL